MLFEEAPTGGRDTLDNVTNRPQITRLGTCSEGQFTGNRSRCMPPHQMFCDDGVLQGQHPLPYYTRALSNFEFGSWQAVLQDIGQYLRLTEGKGDKFSVTGGSLTQQTSRRNPKFCLHRPGATNNSFQSEPPKSSILQIGQIPMTLPPVPLLKRLC